MHADTTDAAAALALLVALLLDDPAVRERVQQDAELQAAMNDPLVRQHVTQPPPGATGMAGVYELVRLLLDNPAVQARVEADSTLRSLWADPAVRLQIRREGHH